MHPELTRAEDDPWLQEIAVLAAAVAHFRRLEQLSAEGGAPTGARLRLEARGSGWRR
jgi:hypothetical protein